MFRAPRLFWKGFCVPLAPLKFWLGATGLEKLLLLLGGFYEFKAPRRASNYASEIFGFVLET